MALGHGPSLNGAPFLSAPGCLAGTAGRWCWLRASIAAAAASVEKVRSGVLQMLRLVFRLRHLVPLAAPDRPSVGDIGNTSNLMILVQLMHLTFGSRPSRERVPNVRCAALVFRLRHLVPLAAPDRPSVGDIGNTSNLMILVQLMHLTFGSRPSRERVPNVRCAALGSPWTTFPSCTRRWHDGSPKRPAFFYRILPPKTQSRCHS